MFNLLEVGPRIDGNSIHLGVYLPSITRAGGFSVKVYIIAEQDQFNPAVDAQWLSVESRALADNEWGRLLKDYWEVEIPDLAPGTYLYRYEITGPDKRRPDQLTRSLYFGDPFARETSSGVFSVFRLPAEEAFNWAAAEDAFHVPDLSDVIIYELMIDEFHRDFDGVIQRLPYLQSLGINVIELLPISGVSEPSQWGYMPIFYFAPEERYGGKRGFKELVKACHREGIAVILEVVYAHADFLFPYQVGYDKFFDLWFDAAYVDAAGVHHSPNPMACAWNNFGNKHDFRMQTTLEFFEACNRYWMSEYHVDGFRYDHVNGYLEKNPHVKEDGAIDWYAHENRPLFQALQRLTNTAYQDSLQYERFQRADGGSRIIQIVEDLDDGPYQLSNNGSAVTGCWDKRLYHAASNMARSAALGHDFFEELLMGATRWQGVGSKLIGGQNIPAWPIRYIESHDESRLLYQIMTGHEWSQDSFEFIYGLGDKPWYKLQPYAIALLTSVGVPMLWQGQEFAEHYGLPERGVARVRAARPLHWDYFYSREFQFSLTVLPLIQLYRKLGALRHQVAALRGGRNHAKIEYEDAARRIAVYRRWTDTGEVVIVILNFDEQPHTVPISFGHTGTWREQLWDTVVQVADGTAPVDVTVRSHYGMIFLLT